MTSAPLPTRLVFLNDLQSIAPGEKVRFLGCVTNYTTATGTLTLQHAYPPPPHLGTTALVDINLLLENLKATDTQIGEWVNIVGYVERWPEGSRQGKRHWKPGGQNNPSCMVQAIMLWSATSVRLREYEDALERRLEFNGR
ncbi:hypothetical protein MMC12_008015 [Toensbergia leucococca]|nr:hypothetical protein [Toensbergia leucococca]